MRRFESCRPSQKAENTSFQWLAALAAALFGTPPRGRRSSHERRPSRPEASPCRRPPPPSLPDDPAGRIVITGRPDRRRRPDVGPCGPGKRWGGLKFDRRVRLVEPGVPRVHDEAGLIVDRGDLPRCWRGPFSEAGRHDPRTASRLAGTGGSTGTKTATILHMGANRAGAVYRTLRRRREEAQGWRPRQACRGQGRDQRSREAPPCQPDRSRSPVRHAARVRARCPRRRVADANAKWGILAKIARRRPDR